MKRKATVVVILSVIIVWAMTLALAGATFFHG